MVSLFVSRYNPRIRGFWVWLPDVGNPKVLSQMDRYAGDVDRLCGLGPSWWSHLIAENEEKRRFLCAMKFKKRG